MRVRRPDIIIVIRAITFWRAPKPTAEQGKELMLARSSQVCKPGAGSLGRLFPPSLASCAMPLDFAPSTNRSEKYFRITCAL